MKVMSGTLNRKYQFVLACSCRPTLQFLEQIFFRLVVEASPLVTRRHDLLSSGVDE